MTPQQLTEEYIFAHDLREASAKIYRAATKALLKHFGPTATVQEVDHRSVLGWRRKVLEQGLSKRSWNTYSNHLRTIWGYAIEHELVTHSQVNPFRKTTVIPPRRASKTVAAEAILRARNWLNMQVGAERCTGDRARITPAWFWLCTFEVFYYTGIRLNALLCIRKRDIDWDNQLILIRGETEKTHKEFVVPITEGLVPHLSRLLKEADKAGFADDDQLFNVNRFSPHYKSKVMNSDQVEAMYRKLTEKVGGADDPAPFPAHPGHRLDEGTRAEHPSHEVPAQPLEYPDHHELHRGRLRPHACRAACQKPGPRRARERQEGGLQRLPASLCQTEAMRATSRSNG